MASDYDLKDVDPSRRAIVLRRLQEIESFLQITNPTPIQRQAAADRLGVTVTYFYAMLKAWRETHDASKLPGASTQGARVGRARSVDRAVFDLARDVATRSQARTIKGVEAEVRTAIAEAGLRLPSPLTLLKYIRPILMARRSRVPVAGNLLIDCVLLKVAVQQGEIRRLPCLTVLFSLPSKRPLAWRVTFLEPALKDLRDMIVSGAPRMPAEDQSEIWRDAPGTMVTAPMLDVLPELDMDLAAAGWRRRGFGSDLDRNGHFIEGAFGRLIGGFWIRQSRMAAAPGKALRTSTMQAVCELVALQLDPQLAPKVGIASGALGHLSDRLRYPRRTPPSRP